MSSTLTSNQLLAVGVALTLVLAGCSTGPRQPSPQPDAPVKTSTTIPPNTPTQVSTATPTSAKQGVLSFGQVEFHNASMAKIEAINETMGSFFEKLPENQTERNATVATVAQKSCRGLSPVNETMFTSASFAHKRGLQLYHAARVMNNNFNSRINPTRIRSMARTSAQIGKYTTIVGTYNDYRKAACAFNRDKPETMEDYYLASAALGVELLMFQYGMYYKTAFKANRAISHHRTFRVIQSTFGDEALGLTMSGSYWLVHGSLHAAPDYVRSQADAMNITLNQEADGIVHHSAVEELVGSNVIPRNMSEKALRCYNKIKNQPEDNGRLLDQAKDLANDLKGDLLNGDYSVSSVVKSANGIDPSELSEEQMKKIKKCIEDSD